MKRLFASGAAAALLFLACATNPPGPGPAPAAAGRPRAILISFDGLAGTRLARLMKEGKLPAFSRLAARGFSAERSVPPTPSLTSVSHVTIATGALPRDTGIVSNTFLDRIKGFPERISGFDAPIRVETLWEAARRQGKRVGVVTFPGTDGKTPARTADWAMTYVNDAVVKSSVEMVPETAWKPGEDRPAGSFSPARRVTLAFGKTAHALTLVALDETDDGRVNYDHLRVEPEAGEKADVTAGDWFPAEVSGEEGRTGAWCKLLSLAPDLSRVEVYMGGLYRSAAYPDELRRELDEKVGFWPGGPDDKTFGADSPRPEGFLEQAERFADFFTRADVLAIARPDWDLLLLYQPEVDEVGHELLLADPRQEGYSPERAAKLSALIDRAYAAADRALDRIDRALSPGDSIFVTSDHGMVPIWSEISVNEILRAEGFYKRMPDGKVDPASTAAAATSGGIAHVYLNASAPAGTLEKIEKSLAAFRVAGEAPWDRIVRRAEAGPLGLDAPESGDLIAIAKPGYSLSMSLAKDGNPVKRPGANGMHGYVNSYPDLDASFLSAGPGIARGRAAEIKSWQIAARIAKALAIAPPRNAAPSE